MKLNPSLSKLLFLPALVILFSLGFFSFKSEAAVTDTLPMTIAYSTNAGYTDALIVDSSAYSHFLFSFIYHRTSDNYFLSALVFDARTDVTVTCRNGLNQTTYPFYPSSYMSTYVYKGVTYYYLLVDTSVSNELNYWGFRINTNLVYSSFSSAFDAWEASKGPEFADFGLKDFDYVTYTNQNTLIPNDIYQLAYFIHWSGSTNHDFPLTSVNYQLYGFNSVSMSNTDKSNGVLIDSGTCSSPFNYDVYSKVRNFVGQTNYEKFVLYLIPFSNNTEGNTSFIVCNCYTAQLSLDFGYLEVPVGGITGLEATYGSGTIPVTPTDIINNSGVNYIDGVPVIGIIQNISGSFNTNTNYYQSYNNYNPVVYDTTNNINNYYDQSSHITNNDNSTTIINNFNGSVNLDNASADGILSFLTALVTFFNTFWSYVIVCLNWLPSWCIVFITTIFTTTASIIVILGILKLVR